MLRATLPGSIAVEEHICRQPLVDRVLMKPAGKKELAAAVRAVLDRSPESDT